MGETPRRPHSCMLQESDDILEILGTIDSLRPLIGRPHVAGKVAKQIKRVSGRQVGR